MTTKFSVSSLPELHNIQMYGDGDTYIHLNHKRVDVSCSFDEITNDERFQGKKSKTKTLDNFGSIYEDEVCSVLSGF